MDISRLDGLLSSCEKLEDEILIAEDIEFVDAEPSIFAESGARFPLSPRSGLVKRSIFGFFLHAAFLSSAAAVCALGLRPGLGLGGRIHFRSVLIASSWSNVADDDDEGS